MLITATATPVASNAILRNGTRCRRIRASTSPAATRDPNGMPRCQRTASRTRASQRRVITLASRRAPNLYQESRLLRARQYSSDSTPSIRSTVLIAGQFWQAPARSSPKSGRSAQALRSADALGRSMQRGAGLSLVPWSSLGDHAARVPGPRAEDERARGETRTACVAHAFLVRRCQRGEVLAGRAEGEGERLPEVGEVFI